MTSSICRTRSRRASSARSHRSCEQAEIDRAKRKPTANLGAYDLYLRGMAALYGGYREDHCGRARSVERAIELDPDMAAAYGAAAWCHLWRKVNGWVMRPKAGGLSRARASLAALSNWGATTRSRSRAAALRWPTSTGDLDGGYRAARPGGDAQSKFGGGLVFLGGFLRVSAR